MAGGPVDFDELYPGRFLKAGTLRGKKVTLEIASVETEPLPDDRGKDRVRGVVSFRGKQMQLVLNKTNGLCLKAMFGRKVQDWVGKRITLFPTTYGADECIRIWGSPELSENMTVEIALPRKKPFQMTMHAAGREPGQEG